MEKLSERIKKEIAAGAYIFDELSEEVRSELKRRKVDYLFEVAFNNSTGHGLVYLKSLGL